MRLFFLLFIYSISCFSANVYEIRDLGLTGTYFPTIQSACDVAVPIVYPNNTIDLPRSVSPDGTIFQCVSHEGNNYYTYPNVYLVTGQSCPSGYIEDSAGNCVPNSCPLGQIDLGNGCADICSSGTIHRLNFFLPTTPYEYVDPAGCHMTLQGNEQCYYAPVEKDWFCSWDYSETGQFTDPATFDYSSQSDETNATGTTVDPVTTESFSSQSTTSTLPDGTQQTTVTDTTTKTLDSGTTIEKIGNTVVKKDSSGSIIQIIEQDTFNTYPDGTAQQTITTTTTATQSTDNITEYDIFNQTTNVYTSSSGASGSTTETTVISYDGHGSITSSNSTTTGNLNTGDGSVDTNGDGEGDLPAFCDYASIVCDLYSWFTETPTLPEPDTVPTYDVELEAFSSGLPVGECPAPIVLSLPNPFGGTWSVSIEWTYLCALALKVRPVLIAFSWLLALYIVIRVK